MGARRVRSTVNSRKDNMRARDDRTPNAVASTNYESMKLCGFQPAAGNHKVMRNRKLSQREIICYLMGKGRNLSEGKGN